MIRVRIIERNTIPRYQGSLSQFPINDHFWYDPSKSYTLEVSNGSVAGKKTRDLEAKTEIVFEGHVINFELKEKNAKGLYNFSITHKKESKEVQNVNVNVKNNLTESSEDGNTNLKDSPNETSLGANTNAKAKKR